MPYLSGERTPHADPDARGCFIGLTLAHGRGHLVRSIMEGVAYSLRDSLEIFEGLGVPIRQIRASGGGSRSPLWRQIQADVFGRNVVTINSEEGAAYGGRYWRPSAPAGSRISRKPVRPRFAWSRNARPSRRQETIRPRLSRLSAALPSLKEDFKSIALLERLVFSQPSDQTPCLAHTPLTSYSSTCACRIADDGREYQRRRRAEKVGKEGWCQEVPRVFEAFVKEPGKESYLRACHTLTLSACPVTWQDEIESLIEEGMFIN